MAKREIVLDTETTGLDPSQGHRLVEIAAVEIIDRKPTGNEYHIYINPERDVPMEAFRVHGLSSEFLKDKPVFRDIYEEFLGFIQNDNLIFHNAPFDVRFINAELAMVPLPHGEPRVFLSNVIIDTLQMAREKFPGQSNSLDALCRRFNVSLQSRTKHGALIDSRLLVEVYVQLLGGWEKQFGFESEERKQEAISHTSDAAEEKIQTLLEALRSRQLQNRLTPEEVHLHHEFMKTFR